MNGRAGRVTGDDRASRHFGRFQTCLPAGMRTVRNHPDAIHFCNCRATEIAEPRIGRFATAITDHVATLIGQMHHANAELKKDLHVRQLVFFRIPFLSQRDSVSGHVQRMSTGGLRGFHICGNGGFCHKVSHELGGEIEEDARGVYQNTEFRSAHARRDSALRRRLRNVGQSGCCISI